MERFSSASLAVATFIIFYQIYSPSANLVKLTPDRTPTCLYNNRTYLPGDKFKPDPCTYCRCPHRGGRARCAIQDCMKEANCVQFDRSEDTCCGHCVQYGCIHSDRQVYKPGAEIVVSSCERCVCPEGGGRTICDKVQCPRLRCIDPVQEQGQCCPTCPNGPNCWLDGQIIPAGKVVRASRCRRCQCPRQPPPVWLQGKLKAVCANRCRHRAVDKV